MNRKSSLRVVTESAAENDGEGGDDRPTGVMDSPTTPKTNNFRENSFSFRGTTDDSTRTITQRLFRGESDSVLSPSQQRSNVSSPSNRSQNHSPSLSKQSPSTANTSVVTNESPATHNSLHAPSLDETEQATPKKEIEQKVRSPRIGLWSTRPSQPNPGYGSMIFQTTSHLNLLSESQEDAKQPYQDDGLPSDCILDDLQRSLELCAEERHLIAYDLYRDARHRLQHLRERVACASAKQKDDNAFMNGKTGSSVSWMSLQNAKAREEAEFKRRKKLTMDQKQVNESQDLLNDRRQEFDKLEDRAKVFQKVKDDLTIDDDWKESQTLFGVSTHYRHEEHDGSLSVKLEGELIGIPLFEQLCVLRECDLFHKWLPFCVQSSKVAELGKLDSVAWFKCSPMRLFHRTISKRTVFWRDAVFRAGGCDCMREDGSIMLVGESLDYLRENSHVMNDDDCSESPISPQHDLYSHSGSGGNSSEETDTASGSDTHARESPSHSPASAKKKRKDGFLQSIPLPPVQKGFGDRPLMLRSVASRIDVLSPSSARTRIVANVDLSHFEDEGESIVRRRLMELIIRKMFGLVLSRLQVAARNMIVDPVHSPHAKRMREDVKFYRDFLVPRFQSYCDDLGWPMPVVSAYNVTEDDLDDEELLEWDRTHGAPTIRADEASKTRESANAEQDNAVVELTSLAASTNSIPNPIASDKANTNLITRYLNEKERKAKVRLARSVRSVRRNAVRLDQPRPLSENERSRLEQLKELKAHAGKRPRSRTLAQLTGTDGVNGTPIPRKAFLPRLGRAIFNRFNKILVMFAVTLFVLYSDLFGAVTFATADSLDAANKTFAMGRMARGGVTLALLCFFALLHWSICTESIIYAFDHIEFGQKQGKLSRGLFVSTLFDRAAYVSSGIIFASLADALAFFLLKNGIKSLLMLSRHIVYSFHSTGVALVISLTVTVIHDAVPGFCWILAGYLVQGVKLLILASSRLMAKGAILIGMRIAQTAWYQHRALRAARSILRTSTRAAMVMLTAAMNYVWKIAREVEYKVILLPPWRSDAIEACRFLVSYSLIFLLAVILIAAWILPAHERYAKAAARKKRTSLVMEEQMKDTLLLLGTREAPQLVYEDHDSPHSRQSHNDDCSDKELFFFEANETEMEHDMDCYR